MKKNLLKKIACALLTAVIFCTSIAAGTTPVNAAGESYVNIIHKVSTAEAHVPVKYNFSLSHKADIYFIIHTNERSGATITVREPVHDTELVNHYLPSSDPDWEYKKDTGIYENTDRMSLDAGNYILELSFDMSVNFELSMNELTAAASLVNPKMTLTKGFSSTIKVNGGIIKSCSSGNKKVATVNNKGKVTAKKTGTAKITVTLTNGKKLTCTVTVKANKYTAKKPSISDVPYNTYGMKAYSASFDKKGNLVVKFTVVNNSYGKIESIPKFAITVKDTKGNTTVSYKKSSYSVTVKSYSVKNCTVTVPKSSLKKSMKSIDLRTSKLTVSGDSANAAF